jgi:hypothetical protein
MCSSEDLLDKRKYIYKRSHSFKLGDMGKWVIFVYPKKKANTIERLFLVDRNKTKKWWWSPAASYAMIFDTKEMANLQANKYKYNRPTVIQISAEMAYYDL